MSESDNLIIPQATLKPTILDIKEQHALQVEDIKLKAEIEDKQWKSCCWNLHKESTLFFGKLLISILTIGLCSYQLIRNIDSNSQALYSSLLSSVLTFWLSKKN